MKTEFRVALHLPSNYRINDLYLPGIYRHIRAFEPPWKVMKVHGTKESPAEVQRHCFRTWHPPTDFFSVEDDPVAKAMDYIRRNISKNPTISEVAKFSGVSRIGLEVKFRRLLKSTPPKELRKLRLRKAKELLTETELTLKEIADLTGFKHVVRLSTEFKRLAGVTPGEFRRKNEANSK